MNMVFPLITFPYILKVLGVNGIGQFSFSTSFISYFILMASLGISPYAIREGARIRDNREKLSIFASEVFSINVVSTIIAYSVLFILIFLIPKLQNYFNLLLILSIQIVFTTIGVEWLYAINEDFLYITLRSIFFNIISIVLLFTFVHQSKDLYVYAEITVLASVGANIINYNRSKKYCTVKLTKHLRWRTHIKPILTLFAMQVATTIYISSDNTILGFLWNDRVVGLYSASAKIYSVIKSVLSSIIVVSIPKLSLLLGNKRINDFEALAYNIYTTLLTFVIPAILGIILLREEIILFLSNKDYLESTSSLMILSIALFFCLGAWFWGQAILVPMKKEKYVFTATMISAIVNIVMNFILIPIGRENAAAFTTVLAEAIAFFLQWYEGRKYIKLRGIWIQIAKVTVGCVGILITYLCCKPLQDRQNLYIICVLAGSVFIYIVIELLLKNEAISFCKK